MTRLQAARLVRDIQLATHVENKPGFRALMISDRDIAPALHGIGSASVRVLTLQTHVILIVELAHLDRLSTACIDAVSERDPRDEISDAYTGSVQARW